MNPVYIQDIASFLPNSPVSNDAMEGVLGQVGARPSRARRLVLRSNGIRQRYYAIDPETGALTHNNAQLTAEAVRRLQGGALPMDAIELLACGTSSPDQLMPNHAVMVHGALGNPPCEVASLSGICMSGVASLRHASLAVAAGVAQTAVATASELASTFMRAAMFAEDEASDAAEEVARNPEQAFRREFLRWMLSDGAGAMLLRGEPAERGLSLRLDWIEQMSFADQMPVCMYAGGDKDDDESFHGWREHDSVLDAARQGSFNVKQDVRLLNEHIVDVCFRQGLERVRERRDLRAEAVDWFVPHYSSRFFRPRLAECMEALDFVIPDAHWYSCLADIGNVGSASIYLHLARMREAGLLERGQRLLCFVPESGRFSTAFMHLTVVDHEG